MAYLSLYRKWRPQAFSEVVGQEHIVRTLTNALQTGRVAHAYLFSGPRGTGKTTFARLVAKGLNCAQGPTGAPCNTCENCTRIVRGVAVDVIEIDGASNRGIDEIRELRDRVKYAPTEGRYKVYIIDEVHMLTNEAFNALLKVLEEPPAHVVFIFATTESHKVPATILSRCQKFDFRRFSPQQLLAQLEKVASNEGVKAEPEALALIARHAEGGMRDALAILDQCMASNAEILTARSVTDVLGVVRREALVELAANILSRNVGSGLQLIHALLTEGVEARQLLKDLASYMRDLVLLKAAPGVSNLVAADTANLEQMQAQANTGTLSQLLAAVEVLMGAEAEMRWSSNPALAVELTLVRAITTPDGSNTAEMQISTEVIRLLENRIAKLEAAVNQGGSSARHVAMGTQHVSEPQASIRLASTASTATPVTAGEQVMPPVPVATVTPTAPTEPNSGAQHIYRGSPSDEPESLNTAQATNDTIMASGLSGEKPGPARPISSVQTDNSPQSTIPPSGAIPVPNASQTQTLSVPQPAVAGTNDNMRGKLQTLWPNVLTALKEERLISLEAFLHVGVPGEINGRTVVIYFSSGHKFHQANVENAKNKSAIERVISRVIGTDISITTAVGSPPPPTIAVPAIEETATPEQSSPVNMVENVTPGVAEQAAGTDEVVQTPTDAVQSSAVQKALRYLGGRVTQVNET